MIGEFELYHGAALRSLILATGGVLQIGADDKLGRVNSYSLNGSTCVYIKHSSKRLPPWQFTFLDDHVEELNYLAENYQEIWILLICGRDGVAALSLVEFRKINRIEQDHTPFVRVDRSRNTMYRLNGSRRGEKLLKARGVEDVVENLI